MPDASNDLEYSVSSEATAALAEAFSDAESAAALAARSGFPTSQIPRFTDSITFWSLIVQKARSGAMADGIRPILRAASLSYPYHSVFGPYRTKEHITTARAESIHPDGRSASASLVESIVEGLSRMRRLPEGSPGRSEVSANVDEAVRSLRQLFSPGEDSVVAGARLERVIGAGNFGTVWQADSQSLGRKVAVKVFRLERLTEGQMLHRFRRSIVAMRRLSERKRLDKKARSQGTVVGFLEEDSTSLAFSMEFLSGGNLDDVARLKWGLDKKIEIMVDICSAIHYSHSNGVIHRDIKPANIVLDGRGMPVLTDFDIADIKWATSLSTAGDGGLGTPVFAAPEQLFDAEKADERSDIYSLGRLLYYLVLERSPGYAMYKDNPLDNLAGEPPGLVAVIRKSTQFDPNRRYSTVADMITALEECMGKSAIWKARVSRVLRGTRRHWAISMMILVVVMGLVGGLIYQAQQTAIQQGLTEKATQEKQRAEEAMLESERLRELVLDLGEKLDDYERRQTEYVVEKNRLIAIIVTRREELSKVASGTPAHDKLLMEISKDEHRLNIVEKHIDELRLTQASLRKQLEAARATGKNRQHRRKRSDSRGHHSEKSKASPETIKPRSPCNENGLCIREGLCGYNGTSCYAREDADCRASEGCKESGKCQRFDEACAALSDSDCADSRICAKYGECYSERGGCVGSRTIVQDPLQAFRNAPKTPGL